MDEPGAPASGSQGTPAANSASGQNVGASLVTASAPSNAATPSRAPCVTAPRMLRMIGKDTTPSAAAARSMRWASVVTSRMRSRNAGGQASGRASCRYSTANDS